MYTAQPPGSGGCQTSPQISKIYINILDICIQLHLQVLEVAKIPQTFTIYINILHIRTRMYTAPTTPVSQGCQLSPQASNMYIYKYTSYMYTASPPGFEG